MLLEKYLYTEVFKLSVGYSCYAVFILGKTSAQLNVNAT